MNKKFLNFLKKIEKERGLMEQWKVWCKKRKSLKDRERIVIEAILTQRTNWKNVEKAMKNLEKGKIYLREIKKIGDKNIENLYPFIKPCGFYKKKAKYLYNLSKFFSKYNFDIKRIMKEDVENLRRELLKIKGVGKETADSILLYALDKPVFVVDEYTRRIIKDFSKKYKINVSLSYEKLRKFFEEMLGKDFRIYQKVHAMIVVYGKNLKH